MVAKRTGLVVALGFLVIVAVQGDQRGWVAPLKSSVGSSRQGALIVEPRAEVGDRANGVYCTAPIGANANVHDLGWLPAGINVTVTVEGLSDGFDPVAAVIVASLGEQAGNNIKTTTFYDNDSGGDKDPKISFVTPQAGTYILLVNDYPDKTTGCYRYEVFLR